MGIKPELFSSWHPGQDLNLESAIIRFHLISARPVSLKLKSALAMNHSRQWAALCAVSRTDWAA